ncbi:glycoside hydrolase family 26 protein [Rhodotorula toruloides]|uniref:BY PROTMAP: gi/472585124/gb/EMS22690.1/ glycoside hydrolase family 26 protein [Rhodosporidium toruloides NP11] gi/647400113/emb/CDR45238.1/ RHTO0S10e07052g1_1 [Rhodosporidium toruloides] n=1 Tax=Rhodotorula toruloides TaxID=5286 RepID=A0A0K3CEI3_RHOTO|nr:glycoside hydrolase family 26 protein [Rhodotorula toruloides]PRQ74255.1 Glycoside hydrolase superfamily [Rhodotorula toruloides]
MHFFTALSLVALGASTASAGCHRRHHAKIAASISVSGSSSLQAASSSASSASQADATVAVQYVAKGSAASSSSWQASSTASSSAAASTSSSTSSSSSSGSIGWGLNGLKKNGISFGWLPDDGSGGGTAHTIQQIEAAVGQKTSAQGWYAQAQSGTLFDGSQFSWRKDQILSGGVFQPAVMPTGGWWGLTYQDNQQAVAICNVMKEYTDAGVEVWLRFAHEVNYYQEDGTYQGGVSDFKEGWDVVAKACRQIAPKVKMWYTPNVASLDQYDQYFPDDASTVDLIGVDWYPKQTDNFDFATGPASMKAFHDKYTSSSGIKFAIGEIGLGQAAPMAARVAWLENILASGSQMPNMIAVSWFNYMKGYDFRIAACDGDSVTKTFFAA